MPKVVINACFGGFGLSNKASMRYAELKGFKLYAYATDFGQGLDRGVARQIKKNEFVVHYSKAPVEFGKPNPSNDGTYWYDGDIARDDVALVKVVEELGSEANGECAELKVVDVPNGVEWEISEYDGFEHVSEKHRTWN